jgi:hypothetical protein
MSATNPRAQDTRALQLALGSGLGPITGPLVNGQALGAFVYVKGKALSSTADTTITLNMTRTPQGYIQTRAAYTDGGVITDGSNGGSDWAQGKIVLRASVTGTYSFFVF